MQASDVLAVIAAIAPFFAVGLSGFIGAFYYIDRKRREDVRSLHEKFDRLEALNQRRMDSHNEENRKFREKVLQRLLRLELLTNGKDVDHEFNGE